MKVTLSFEKTVSEDISIMVDALRASSTITLALDKFEKIIPCLSAEEGLKIKKENGGVLAGERKGEKIEGFDVGNTPVGINEYETDEKTLILTTSNGTRILDGMDSTVLVGCLVNAKAVAEKSLAISEDHIDVVMAGVRGEFSLEDFLASGEILYWICKNLDEYEINDMAKAAIMASRDHNSLKMGFYNSRAGKHLAKLGYKKDIDICCKKNICKNVAIYENKELKSLND